MPVEINILAYCNNPKGMTNCAGLVDPSCPLNRLKHATNKSSAGTLAEFWSIRNFFIDDIRITRLGPESEFVSCQRYCEAVRAVYGLAVLSVVK